MKRLFYLLTTFAIILSSCSSDETANPKVDIDGAKYAVNLNVSGFKLTEKPLLRANIGINDFYLQYVFYKEDGTVYETDRVLIDSPTANNIMLNKEVLAGKYHVAIIISNHMNKEIPESYLEPIHLDSDWIRSVHTYFNLTTIDVTPDGVDLDVLLDPMWSTLDIKFSDAATCYIPEETEVIACFLSKSGGGFYLKNRAPLTNPHWEHQWITHKPVLTEEFRLMNGFFNNDIGGIDMTTLTLRFQKRGVAGGVDILHERILYVGGFERGKHYTLEGEIGTPNAESGIKISVADFEDIILPFD